MRYTSQYTGGYNNITVGNTRGVGTLTVEGEGSLVETYGDSNRIVVRNNYGDGFLTIRDGGTVRTISVNAGRSNGNGIVNVTGETSLLHLTNATGVYGTARYAGSGGFTTFGRSGGEGSLRVSDGGSVIAENVDGLTDAAVIRFGRDYGSEGFGELIGQDSSIDIIQHGVVGDQYSGQPGLRVGEGGQGELALSQGASVSILGDQATLHVARGRGGQGAQDQSELSVTSGSTVTVDGGLYNAGRVIIAEGENTNGLISIDGVGSTLTVTTSYVGASDYSSAEILVGGAGIGRLTITNDGTVNAREVEVATIFGSTPFAGNGYINITSGGTLNLDSPDNPNFAGDPNNNPTGSRGLRVAERNNYYGRVDVDGEGSAINVTGGAAMVRIGRSEGAKGRLTLTNGAELNGFFFDIGRQGGEGYVLVSGAGLAPGDDLFQTSRPNIFQEGVSNDGVNPGTYSGPLLQIGRTSGRGTIVAEYGAEINVRGEGARVFVGQSSDGSGPAPRSTLEINTGALVTVESFGYQVASQVSVGTESTGFGGGQFDTLLLDFTANNTSMAGDDIRLDMSLLGTAPSS